MEVADIDGLLLAVNQLHKGSVFLRLVGAVPLGDEVLGVVSVIIVGNMRLPFVAVAVGRHLPRVPLLGHPQSLLSRVLFILGVLSVCFCGESAGYEFLGAVGLQRFPASKCVDIVTLLTELTG